MVIFLTSYLSQQPTPIPKAVEQSDNVSVPEPTIDWGGPMEDVNNDSIIDERDAALMTHE
ncbi:hypothetical protein HY468_05680 [Candidatus Roizmanbacteria bacterium]|nr:hypothetical protein [Candidatus Roizmanbacteria bacterium]